MSTLFVQGDPLAEQVEVGGAEDFTPAEEGGGEEEGLEIAKEEQLEEEGDSGGRKDGVGQEEDQDSDAGWETDLELEGTFYIVQTVALERF